MPHTAESPAVPRESYRTPQDVRLALERMDLTSVKMAALERYWLADQRPRETIQRGFSKLASRRRKAATPWWLQVILYLMERSPELWQADLPRAATEWKNAETLPRLLAAPEVNVGTTLAQAAMKVGYEASSDLQSRKGEKLAQAVQRAGEASRQKADRFAERVGPLALELQDKGLKLAEIAAELTKGGVQTPAGREWWSAHAVRVLLARAQRVLEATTADQGAAVEPD